MEIFSALKNTAGVSAFVDDSRRSVVPGMTAHEIGSVIRGRLSGPVRVSEHLRDLTAAGLLVVEGEAGRMVYRLNVEAVQVMSRFLTTPEPDSDW